MEYRNLGNSGLQVSVVGLGCNNLGRQVDAEGTAAIVDKCLDLGVTFFDTSDVYGVRGTSEEHLGRALKAHRRDVVIATKSGMRMGEGPYWGGTARRYLMDAVDACLRRLGTDYIDLYQMHTFDQRVPIEETLRALDDMVRSGRVRYVGCCNYAAWQVADAAGTAGAAGLTGFITAQNRYNLLERQAERELVPACQAHGVSLLPYYPLASGLLTGKYRAGAPPPEGSRLTMNISFYAGGLEKADFGLLGRLEEYARDRGHTLIELAIGWLASQPYVGSVTTGATSPAQIEQNVASADWRLSADELAEVDALLAGETPAA